VARSPSSVDGPSRHQSDGLLTTDYGLIRRDLCLAQNVEISGYTNEKVS
jgi:hypothetical protein